MALGTSANLVDEPLMASAAAVPNEIITMEITNY